MGIHLGGSRLEAWRELKRITGLDKSFECAVCHKDLPDRGVLMSVLVETPTATGARHFCSMEHLTDYLLRLKMRGSPLYEVLRESAGQGLTLKDIFGRIEELEGMVVEGVRRKVELEERIKALEEERANLQTEIEAFRALPELEAKAAALETEVAKLREEKKTLEEKASSHACEETPPIEEEVSEGP